MQEFIILKSFVVDIDPRRTASYVTVFWPPPPSHQFKCNTDWVAKDYPGVSGCGGIFRDHHASMWIVCHI